jgi:hypothetical protein
MNKLSTIQVTGKVSATQAASDPSDYIRNQEFLLALSGVAPRSHTHTASQITDLEDALGELLLEILANTDTVSLGTTAGSLTSFNVRLKPTGGLLSDTQGLYLDPSQVSVPGHTHEVGDITDFADSVQTRTSMLLLNSPTIEWVKGDAGFSGLVRTKTNGGILTDPTDGLYLDFGTGANQAARGNHVHSQLHNPLTLAQSASLSLSLNGQQLSAEVMLASLGGLLVNSGVAVDFGTGHSQAARGDHTHAGLGAAALTVANTDTLALFLDGSNLLSGVLRLDAAPSFGRGRIGSSSAGLYAVLGANADTAAAGNHGHNTATGSADGFMSAQDKAKLDSLGQVEFIFDPPLVLSGTHVYMPPASPTGNGYMSVADKAKLDSIDATPLTFTAPLILSGHNVSLPQSNASSAGYLSSVDWTNFNSKAAGSHTHPNATTSVAGFMSPTDKSKLEGLLPLTVQSTSSLDLFLAANTTNEVLSGVVRLDPTPSAARGKLGTSPAGLYVKLGGTSDVAAAGDHIHPDATQTDSGFMSAADKIKLDGITGDGNSLTYDPPLQLIGGNEVAFSYAAPLTLAGGQLTIPAASASQDGYMSAADKTKLDSITGGGSVYSGGTFTGTIGFANDLNPAIEFGTNNDWSIRSVLNVNSQYSLEFLAWNGGSLALWLDPSDLSMSLNGSLKLNGTHIEVNGTQVLGAQQAAIDDAATVTGTATNNGWGFSSSAQFTNFINNVNGAIAQLNRLLAAVRTGTGHGLIASS